MGYLIKNEDSLVVGACFHFHRHDHHFAPIRIWTRSGSVVGKVRNQSCYIGKLVTICFWAIYGKEWCFVVRNFILCKEWANAIGRKMRTFCGMSRLYFELAVLLMRRNSSLAELMVSFLCFAMMSSIGNCNSVKSPAGSSSKCGQAVLPTFPIQFGSYQSWLWATLLPYLWGG